MRNSREREPLLVELGSPQEGQGDQEDQRRCGTGDRSRETAAKAPLESSDGSSSDGQKGEPGREDTAIGAHSEDEERHQDPEVAEPDPSPDGAGEDEKNPHQKRGQ